MSNLFALSVFMIVSSIIFIGYNFRKASIYSRVVVNFAEYLVLSGLTHNLGDKEKSMIAQSNDGGPVFSQKLYCSRAAEAIFAAHGVRAGVDDIRKLAIITLFYVFDYRFMPSGGYHDIFHEEVNLTSDFSERRVVLGRPNVRSNTDSEPKDLGNGYETFGNGYRDFSEKETSNFAALRARRLQILKRSISVARFRIIEVILVDYNKSVYDRIQRRVSRSDILNSYFELLDVDEGGQWPDGCLALLQIGGMTEDSKKESPTPTALENITVGIGTGIRSILSLIPLATVFVTAATAEAQYGAITKAVAALFGLIQ